MADRSPRSPRPRAPSRSSRGSWTTDRRKVAATAILVALLVVGLAATATTAPTANRTASAPSTAPDPQVAALHAEGVTGEGVRVGVIDVSGFESNHPAYGGRVVAAQSFDSGKTVRNGGQNAHGTAAATTLARVAPGADLYLAAFATPEGYERAVEWLVRQDVDVIVAPLAFYGKPGDGSSRVAQVATWAVEQGVVFVAPAGNLGQGHWSGRFDPDDRGLMRFEGDVRNYLDGPDEIALWVSWSRLERHHDFTLELYAETDDGTRLVARSQPYTGDDGPNERILARVEPADAHFVVLRGPENATGVPVRISSPTHALQFNEPFGSLVAPATAHDVVAVGAIDADSGLVEPYSSRGPRTDGRLEVDVLAPGDVANLNDAGEFEGTSAAATYAAGVAALVLDANPRLSPRQVEHVIQESAEDVEPNGVAHATGHGRLVADRAVAAARNATG